MNQKPTTQPNHRNAPRWAQRLLMRITAPHLREEIQGDMDELFHKRAQRHGYTKARLFYIMDLVLLLHPRLWRSEPAPTLKPRFINDSHVPNPLFFHPTMIRHYFTIAFRHLVKNKVYSFINIGGLAVGMAVAVLVGLWVWDELTFDHYHKNHDRIAQVYQSQIFNDQIGTVSSIPRPLEMTVRNDYGDNFKHLVMSSWRFRSILTHGDKKLVKQGNFMQQAAPQMLGLEMLSGQRDGLKDPNSILLAASTAQSLFGNEPALGKLVKLNNKYNLKVTGVYADIPLSNEFSATTFIAPWEHYVNNTDWVKNSVTNWGDNSWQLFVQIADNATMEQVSTKIRETKMKAAPGDVKQYKPVLFLHPMNDWHLRSSFDNGVHSGGRIENVWLFGIIGLFVLLLACINFMNLSTARSEKRAKEVGIRKSVGSVRAQLISQFLSESFLVVGLAFVAAVTLVVTALPAFIDP